jgi:TRAP-type C4-dicarboxylate transport system permease small subunit
MTHGIEEDVEMKGFWKFFDRLSDVMAALAGVLLVLISAAMCYTIFMRFVFRQTTIWIIPMSEYSLLWIVFLGTTWLLREGGHITTDVIYIHLNEKAKRHLNLIMSVVGGLACALLLYLGIVHLCDCILHGVTDVRAMTVPKSAVFIIIPIGSLFLTIQFFRIAWSNLGEIRAGR